LPVTVICYFLDGFMPQIGMGNCRSNILDVRRDQQVLPDGGAANARGLATAMAQGNEKGARTGRPPFDRALNLESEHIPRRLRRGMLANKKIDRIPYGRRFPATCCRVLQ
jgi:hypothetical protein